MRVKKIFSSLLVVAMLFSMLPTSVFAISGISNESANVDIQDDCAYFQYPDNDSEYVYTIIPTDSLVAYGVSDADELVSIINGKCGAIPADLSDDKYDFDAGVNDPDVVNGILNFELYVATGNASVFKESNDMPIYTSGVLVFYRLNSDYVTANAAAYGFPSECPTAYIYSITGLYAEKVEVDDLGGFTFGLDIDDSGLTNATVEADAYSGFEMGDSVSLAIIPNDGFEFTTEPYVDVFGGSASSLTKNSAGVYSFIISDIYDEVSVTVEGEAVSIDNDDDDDDDDVNESIDPVYDISLDTTLLLNAVAELSDDTDVATDDVVTLTITPNTGYAFDVAPVVDVDGATVGSVVDNNDYYTCEITNFTEDTTVTVSGEAKDLVLANGPVAIDYIDPSITDVVWDGSTNITINSEADIYILEAYNHEATMTISADADIVGYGYLTTVTNKKSAFVINNGANVTIDNVRIEREVEPGGQTENLFYIDAASVEANDIDIYEATRGVFELVNDAELVVTGEDTTIESRIGTAGRPIFDNKDGSVTVYDGFFSRGADRNNSGQVVGNGTESTFTMYGGTIVNYYGSTDTIANGNIYIYGGSISGGENAAAIRTGKLTDVVVIENCTIYNSKIAVKVGKDNSGGNVTIGGDVIFEDNETDIYLSTVDSVVTLEDDFTGRASVDTAVNTFPVRITHNGTDEELRDQVYPVDSNSAVNFNYTDGYLYLWNHNHTWNYIEDANEPNKIFAQCEDTDCTYNDPVFIELVAIDGIACDYEYDCIYLIDNLSGIVPDYTITPKYSRIIDDGNIQELVEQPVAMGNYMVEIEIGGATAVAEFIIDHVWSSDCDEICDECPYNRGFNAIHDFSNEVQSSDTLISEADCENNSVYYLTCADCGKISDTETFEGTDSPGHSFTMRLKKASTLISEADCQHGSIYYLSCFRCGTASNSDSYTFEDSDILDCDFTEEVIHDDYLKSVADCENDAVYYMSCNMCEGSSNDDTLTFTVTNTKLNHNHILPQSDHDNHWYKCERCDSIDGVEAHFGGTNTCQSVAICAHIDCNYAYGSVIPCEFTETVVDDDYLKQEADCENNAVYYMSCNMCGESANDDSLTFEALNTALNHDHSIPQYDSNNHWYKCIRCDSIDGVEAHYGGQATCQNPAVCEHSDCGQSYGTVIPCNFVNEVVIDSHIVSEADCENDAVYYLSCDMCGASSNDLTMTFVDTGSNLGHNFVTPQHNSNSHWYKCIRCDEIDGETPHFGGNATCQEPAVCAHLDCGIHYGSVIPCEFTKLEVRADYFKESATCQHGDIYWKSCVMCDAPSNDDALTFAHTAPVPCQFTDEIQSDDYLISEATCQNPAVYTRVCVWCAVGSTNDTDYYEFGTVIPCEFTEEIAHPDYLMEEATCGGPAKFFRSCNMCGASDTDRTNYFEDGLPLEHTYATVYTIGDDTHYYAAICEHTSEKYMETAHAYTEEVASADYLVSEADCVAPTTYYKSCICGKAGTETFTVGEVTDHTYDETVWVTSDTHHWYASTCVHTDAKKNNAEHTASDWIIDAPAQIGVKGSKHKECTVCAKVLETAEIPAKSSGGGSSVSYYTVTTDKTENGTFKVNKTNTYSGSAVTITVNPDDGYEVSSIKVMDSKNNEIDVTKNSDGTYSFKMPSRNVTVSVKFNKTVVKGSYADCKNDLTCPMHNYGDIDTSAWYHDGVHYCLDNGIMVGYGNGEFKPYATTSRAMVAVMLWRLDGSPLVSVAGDFNDVFDTDWYNDAVRWMSVNNIAGGYGEGIWGPNDAITREQLVSILYRYAQYKGIDVSVGEETNILSYDDAFDVSEYAIPAMQWACGAGIVVGDDNKLMPETEASRAQMATIFQRFCVNVLKTENTDN